MLAMLLQFSFLNLTINQWALVGWILGALYSLLVPFYLKVRADEFDWNEFNFGFLVNFIINLIIGVAVSLLVFATWTIPEGAWWAVAILAFGASAGIDQEVIIKILNAIGLYQKVLERGQG
jgi:hypothetical protein